MSLHEPPSPACGEHLAALYRFVFLMTGGDAAPADRVFEKTLERAFAHFVQIRCSRRAAVWLFAEARLQCRRLAGAAAAPRPAANDGEEAEEDGGDHVHCLAATFRGLPEPERAALALFHLSLFTRQELAEVLGVKPEELGLLLLHARVLLRANPAAAPLRDPAFAGSH